jgi:SAM-dependent methyltransferase
MSGDPDELYYRDRYWEWIAPRLRAERVDLSGSFLDAGCGPGRLTIPLARELEDAAGTVVGVDMVPELLEAARRGAAEAGVTNVSFVESDLLEFLTRQPGAAYSGVLCLEVAYMIRDLERFLGELARVLEPGGLLLASFRTRYFLAQLGVVQRDWELSEAATGSSEGLLPGGGWQNRYHREGVIEALSRAGFAEIELQGIGSSSGIAGDPLARLVRPSELDARELQRLAAVERALGASHPDAGRYILAAARRSPVAGEPTG